jgi:hypothetical protein
MSQEQLDLVAQMEAQLAAVDETLAALKETLTDTEPEPPDPPGMIFIDNEADLDAAIAEALPGDNLVIANELVYSKALTISKALTLTAETVPEGRMTREPTLPLFTAGLKVTAADVTLIGLEVNHTNHTTDIVIVSGANVTLDRCRILGDPSEGAKRGVGANAANLTIRQCFIADCFGPYPGNDTQAICAWDTPGPLLIEDNYLEAGSETIMMGGSDPSCEANVPTDITIRGNTITANPIWQQQAVNVKSRLELKNAKHVLIEDNDISQCWGGHGQDGYLLTLTVRNQGGDAPYSTVQNVIVRRNHFSHGAAAINLLGEDDNYDSTRMADIEIVDNVFEDINHTTYTGSPKLMLIGRGPLRTTIGSNTFSGGSHTSTIYFHSPTPKCEEFHVVDNTWPESKYGIFGTDMPSGVSAWDYYVESGSCEGNVTVPKED